MIITDDKDKIIKELRDENTKLKNRVKELEDKLNLLLEQISLAKHKEFGKSSEQNVEVHDNIDNIFNEVEDIAKPEVPEPEMEEITYKRKKYKGQRENQFKNLPIEIIEYEILEEDKICHCGNERHVIGEEIRTEIKIIPAQVILVKHIRHKYGCRNCEKNGIETVILIAPMPKPVIAGSFASASAISYIIYEKYVMGTPLYRLEQQFKRNNIEISRQTMSNWVIICFENLLKHIYKRMIEHLILRDIIQADETTIQVINEPGRTAANKSYMWLYRTGREGPHIIVFEYKETRAGENPKNFLKEFKGFVNCDGYDGYLKVEDVILVGCFAHARRKFVEALKSLPEEVRNSTEPTAAHEGLAFCDKLYSIEHKLANISNDERFTKRIELSRPILDLFKQWLEYQNKRLLPKSATGTAVQYCLNQFDRLEGYLKDGRLEIDNNRSERTMKPFVIGRKNWLFCNTPAGASASAGIYSIVQTCIENNIKPIDYFNYILVTLPNMDLDNKDLIDDLLPWSDKIPESCRSSPTKN